MNNFFEKFHNLIGDDMKELLWNLFRKTGKIEYYVRYKKEEKKINSKR